MITLSLQVLLFYPSNREERGSPEVGQLVMEEIGFNMGLIPDTTSQPRSYTWMLPALPAVFTLTLLAFSVLSLCLTFYLLSPSTLDQDLLFSRGIW